MRSHLSAPNASSPGTHGAGGAFDVSPVAVQRDESGEVVPSEVIYVFSFRILVEFILLQASAPSPRTRARTHGHAHTRSGDADGPARPCAKSWIDEARPAQRPARLRGRPGHRPGHV